MNHLKKSLFALVLNWTPGPFFSIFENMTFALSHFTITRPPLWIWPHQNRFFILYSRESLYSVPFRLSWEKENPWVKITSVANNDIRGYNFPPKCIWRIWYRIATKIMYRNLNITKKWYQNVNRKLIFL